MEIDFRKIAREEIIGIPVYSPGMDIDDVKKRYGVERVIKLASNENPLGPSPLAVEAIKREASDASLYPDGSCMELRSRLADILGISRSSLIFGCGADEVIDFIFLAFFGRGDNVVMGEPTFSSYFISGMTVGAGIVYIPLQAHRHDVGRLLEAVDGRTKAVIVGTPHNPTGTTSTTSELELLLEGLPREVLLVWDEAYREYVDDPDYPESIPYLDRFPNLVILRTFSKIYGLAGLRIGYGIADPRIVDLLEKVRPPFNVNRLAQVAALAALDDDDHLKKSREINDEGKRYLSKELALLGFEPIPTQANFILFRYDNIIGDLSRRLLEKGVVVRDGKSLGYPGHVRMTIGTPDQNCEVTNVLKELVG